MKNPASETAIAALWLGGMILLILWLYAVSLLTPRSPYKAGRNERRRLTANYLNNIAVAFFALGVTTPLLSGAIISEQARLPLAGVGMFMSLVCHVMARGVADLED